MRSLSGFLLVLCLSTVVATQQAPAGSEAVVPTLVNFSGVVRDTNGRPLTEVVGVTFSLYKESQGGAPLWLETQNVQPDKTGHYSVMLGSTTSQGLSADLFVTGEARWLAVRVQGQEEQPRVLLLSVPYALKAADAQTLGGLPASAFVQAPHGGAAGKAGATSVPGSPRVATSALPPATSNVTTTGGTAQHLAMFTKATNIQNSIVLQMGTTAIDVAGKLGINNTMPSQSLDVKSGNAIVRGAGNFLKTGNTATLYLGDTSHPIEAIWGSGLAIGSYKATQALFIADTTGNVGIGTTTPTAGILNAVANSGSVVGFSVVGWNSTGGNGTDAIHATGGSGYQPGDYGNGGVGGVFTGGQAAYDYFSGTGLVAQGGSGGCCGGVGLVANGGGASDSPGDGVVATGGTGYAPGAGVLASGGNTLGQTSGGPGLVGHGNNSTINGGDGIDAMAGTGCNLCTNGLAGSFTGDVSVSGNLTVSGTKHFKIDHPLDPANKYLYHASLESSEVLNFYSGNATLDANGEATVQLPNWFEALNRDFRYQLTAIGAAAPGLHIAQEIQNHSFRIAGGAAAMKVSWQVTAVRQDAWERAHPMVVEVQKPIGERGYYINPELFGAPPERNMDWARIPQVMKRLQIIQAKQANQKRSAPAKIAQATRP